MLHKQLNARAQGSLEAAKQSVGAPGALHVNVAESLSEWAWVRAPRFIANEIGTPDPN